MVKKDECCKCTCKVDRKVLAKITACGEGNLQGNGRAKENDKKGSKKKITQ